MLYMGFGGQVLVKVEVEYDVLLINCLILQLLLEVIVVVKDELEYGIGCGLNKVEVGLCLCYELSCCFVLYIGISYECMFGDIVDYVGDYVCDMCWVVGVCMWF